MRGNMKKIDHKAIYNRAIIMDQWINIKDQLGMVKICDMSQSLINCINDSGEVSYLLNSKGRYRTSTLATVLISLHNCKLLPDDDVHIMQDKLIELKDHFTPYDKAVDDVILKDNDDLPAWGIDEAPSVWTTAKALEALILSEYTERDDIESAKKLRASVYWLADQAYTDGGWGYQKQQEFKACNSNIAMTALAIKVIAMAYQTDTLFNQDAKRAPKATSIRKAVDNGLKYLLSNIKTDDGCTHAWFEFEDKPSISITTWVCDAFSTACMITNDAHLKNECNKYLPNAIEFILSTMPADADSIDSFPKAEPFFIANKGESLKYKQNLQKTKCFYAFTPYIVVSLLHLGVAPSDPRIVAIIKWLLDNREEHWRIVPYNEDSPCAISAAMAIDSIISWLYALSQATYTSLARELLSSALPASNLCPQYGVFCEKTTKTPKQPIQKDSNQRSVLSFFIALIIGITIALCVFSFFLSDLYEKGQEIIEMQEATGLLNDQSFSLLETKLSAFCNTKFLAFMNSTRSFIIIFIGEMVIALLLKYGGKLRAYLPAFSSKTKKTEG